MVTLTWTEETITRRADEVVAAAKHLEMEDPRHKITVAQRFPKSPQCRAIVLCGKACVWSAGDHGERFYDDALAIQTVEANR